MNKTMLTMLTAAAIALTGCGGQPDTLGQDAKATDGAFASSGKGRGVPDHVRDRAESELAGQGRIERRLGCEERTVGQMLAAQQKRAEETGAPVESWLSESSADGRIWVCLFTGRFARSGGDRDVNARVIVPDQIPGAPGIGIDFGPDAN